MTSHFRQYQADPAIVFIQWQNVRIIFNIVEEKALFVFPYWLIKVDKDYFTNVLRQTQTLYDKVIESELGISSKEQSEAWKSFDKWLLALEKSDKVVRLTMKGQTNGGIKV